MNSGSFHSPKDPQLDSSEITVLAFRHSDKIPKHNDFKEERFIFTASEVSVHGQLAPFFSGLW